MKTSTDAVELSMVYPAGEITTVATPRSIPTDCENALENDIGLTSG